MNKKCILFPAIIISVSVLLFSGCDTVNASASVSSAYASGVNETSYVSADTAYTTTPVICKSASAKDYTTIDSISEVGGLISAPEQSMRASQILTNSDNPYDVDWDYGPNWDRYVEMCDWNLVFDADYYMAQYPMLAMQYHCDKDLLLRHFQTVGIHEGRQGNASFNVDAYNFNCSDDVYNAFHNHGECYYLYYMLHYDTEKDINTVTANDGSPVKTKSRDVLTFAQQKELDAINEYRAEVGSDPVIYNAELAAIANYRAYVNVTEHINGHDWLDIGGYAKNEPIMMNWVATATDLDGSFSENNYESMGGITAMPRTIYAKGYASCESHNEAMRRASQKYVGISHMAWDGTNNGFWDEQFDIYAH